MVGSQEFVKLEHAPGRLHKPLRLDNLRADMGVKSNQTERLFIANLVGNALDVRAGDTEFLIFPGSGQILVGSCVHTGVHPDHDRLSGTHAPGNGGHPGDFLGAIDHDGADPGVDGVLKLRLRFVVALVLD